jgi:UDP-N-acetyl-2-amino-2-deoxyglucuronate dehydrogenase
MRHRIAVIGLGMAARPHALALADLAAQGRVEVAAAVSRSDARRAAFAAAFPAFPVTGDLDRVLADPSVTAVLLLTPPDARIDLVRRIAAAGKAILLEKPLERTTAAAETVVRTCADAGVPLGVVFQNRWRAGTLRLRALLAAGAIGDVAAVQLAVSWWRPQSYYDEPGRGTLARDGGGVLLTQAIHALDLMLAFAGPVERVSAIAATTRLHRMETEDFAAAGLVFANGAPGSLVATTAAYPGGPERLTITGTRATATLVGGALTVEWQDGRREDTGGSAGTGGGADPMAFTHEAHRGLIAAFLDALDAGRAPDPDGLAALRVHRLVDAILESGGTGRACSPGG